MSLYRHVTERLFKFRDLIWNNSHSNDLNNYNYNDIRNDKLFSKAMKYAVERPKTGVMFQVKAKVLVLLMSMAMGLLHLQSLL